LHSTVSLALHLFADELVMLDEIGFEFLTNPARSSMSMNATRSRPNRERSLGLITATNETGNSDSTPPPNC